MKSCITIQRESARTIVLIEEWKDLVVMLLRTACLAADAMMLFMRCVWVGRSRENDSSEELLKPGLIIEEEHLDKSRPSTAGVVSG